MIKEKHLTINPYRIDMNEKILINDFRNILIMYYRKTFGRYFNKMKDKQYEFGLFLENGKARDIEKHPHFHIIINLPQEKECDFLEFVINKFRMKYPRLSYCIEDIYDRDGLIGYLNKEQGLILVNKDFY